MRGTSFIRLTGLPHSEYKNGKFFDYHIDNYEGEQYFCDKCGQIKEVRFLTIEYSNKDRQSTQGEKIIMARLIQKGRNFRSRDTFRSRSFYK